MVLFELNKIIKNKYNYYRINQPNKITNINYDKFYQIGIEKIRKIFPFYFSGINQDYIDYILRNTNNKIILSCIDDNFDLKNISSILIYHKTKTQKFIKYYILLLGTHERNRNLGYGKVIIDEFIEWLKITDKSILTKKILLKSVKSSLKFYIDYGFLQSELESNKLFYKYESTKELKSNIENLLEFIIESNI